MRNLLTANQVATRLGVQLKTVYAYVSRGVLERTLADDGKTSLFDAGAVDRLAQRGRPRRDNRQLGSVDVSLATAITCIEADRLLFRGHDVRTLANHPFESVAELLWSGELPERTDWPSESDKEVRALSFSLPKSSPATERLAAVTAALACKQPLRVDLRPSAVMQHARNLLVTLVDCLPPIAAEPTKRRPQRLAARLWPRVSSLPATSARVDCLDTALVLLADHELATSTFAARVAASTRADPFAVVLSGMGAVSGPLHGKAALAAHELLIAARSTGQPDRVLANAISRSGFLPGFGHPVYRGIDPRAECLRAKLLPLVKRADQVMVDNLCAAASATSERQPNIDFALAYLAFALDMPLGASEAIFVIARCAGWIAHALEEYGERALRFRARALYIGARH
ncbi:MAG TPA: citrate/2-methylcitrate synthase [Polyangiales bacterium]|nr:citrate/2-methylcitrate synthase [Polyangiales bacterium]